MRSPYLYALSAFVIALVIASVTFQLYFRYRYVAHGDMLLRIDRLTNVRCQLSGNAITERPCQARWTAVSGPP